MVFCHLFLFYQHFFCLIEREYFCRHRSFFFIQSKKGIGFHDQEITKQKQRKESPDIVVIPRQPRTQVQTSVSPIYGKKKSLQYKLFTLKKIIYANKMKYIDSSEFFLQNSFWVSNNYQLIKNNQLLLASSLIATTELNLGVVGTSCKLSWTRLFFFYRESGNVYLFKTGNQAIGCCVCTTLLPSARAKDVNHGYIPVINSHGSGTLGHLTSSPPSRSQAHSLPFSHQG